MTDETKRSLKRFWGPVAVALAIHVALGLSAAARLTTTHDEYWHLPVGLLNLKTGRFGFDNLNPPLCRIAAAFPLLFTSAQSAATNADHDAMGWGDDFAAKNGRHYRFLFFLGRSMIVLISVLGGLVTAIWARELFGDLAGCLAGLLWAFEPNLIAHGSLVTTDMGAAAFFVFTWYALWKFARRPGWKVALVFGVVLGLAQLVKFTSLLLYPIALVAFALFVLDFRHGRRTDAAHSDWPVAISRTIGLWIIALGVSIAVLNAGYLLRGSFAPLKTYNLQSAKLRDLAKRCASIGWLPVPLPRDYVEGLDHQRHVMEQKHPVYLNGEWSVDGFDHYYLWALFDKLPHPLQILTVITLLWLVIPAGVARRPYLQLAILLPAALMIAAAESSSMQLGIRYVLPAIPFLILFASQAACWLDREKFPLRAVTTVVLAAWMLLSVRYHPEHLAYFNELAGGPLGGRERLLDSNLDWGQDLRDLKPYLDQQGIGEIGLVYFGTVPPSMLGIAYHIPQGRVPVPGRFAVSVNFEQGRPHWVRTPKGEIRPVDVGEFAFFQFFEPVARIGASIDVFEITEADIGSWQSAVRAASAGQ